MITCLHKTAMSSFYPKELNRLDLETWLEVEDLGAAYTREWE